MTFIYQLMGNILGFFSKIMGNNYALALLLVAVAFKILFLYSPYSQQKKQIKSAKLAPKIQAIKDKYRGRTDKPTMQKMQQEIMELQRSEGVSPLGGGCLIMIVQLLFVMLIYTVIRNPLSYICDIDADEMKTLYTEISSLDGDFTDAEAFVAEFPTIDTFLAKDEITRLNAIQKLDEETIAAIPTIRDITLPNLTFLGLNLGPSPIDGMKPSMYPRNWPVVFIPFLAAGSQWLQTFLTKKWNGNPGQAGMADAQQGGSMKIMELIMPLLLLWMAFTLPALLAVYWIFQSLLAILQTFIFSRAMPIPQYTEEDFKRMRKEEKAQEKAQRSVAKRHVHKSLHYIDEDDYDELPDIKKNEQSKNSQNNSAPEIKD